MLPTLEGVDLAHAEVHPLFVERIPLRFAREYGVVGVSRGEALVLVLGKPENVWAADRIAYRLDREVELGSAPLDQVLSLLNHAYHSHARGVAELAGELGGAASGVEVASGEDVLDLEEKAPAVKLVHGMLLQALRQRASDIHLEPGETGLRVRFRIDGVLYDRAQLSADMQESVLSRVKVMAKLDIAERRLPQDGSVAVRVGERQLDLRVATLPSQHGERVVLRLLDKSMGLFSLDRLGFSEGQTDAVRRILKLSHGIILVTGPTGSGKTTTLYAMLSALDSQELNILTLEDPVEYRLPGITQTQVATKKGMTFARGLRSLVRQDPDVIMVGEIRDLETATIAIQSSLTGHVVFSTLHTNDAASSVTRLLDLGVEPYLVASSVRAVMAQRLVRLLCLSCKKPVDLAAAGLDRCEGMKIADAPGASWAVQGEGCASCFGTGFSGRTAITEILGLSEGLRALVMRRAPAGDIKQTAAREGFVSLRENGLRLAREGRTTLEEIWNVTQMDLD